jgi:hypothetical protein
MCLCILLPAKRREASNLPGVQLGKHGLDLFGRFRYQFTRSHRLFLDVQ